MGEYLLGTSDHELARLALQQEVWSGVTASFLERLGLDRPGLRVLDVGCGPGHVTAELLGRVDAGGKVVALDESERWIEHVRARAQAEGWEGVELRHGRIQDVDLEEGGYDVAFLRWVLAFLPDPEAVLARLHRALAPGGQVAVLDYNHEGISVFPESEGFRAAVRACRSAYAARGGDTWLMGSILELFRDAGFEPELFEPHVIAGGVGSPAHRWLDAFFPFHTEHWEAEGLMTAEERATFLREWRELGENPSAAFFSPIVVAASARKP